MKLVIINKRPWAVGLMWATRDMNRKPGGKLETETAFRRRLALDPAHADFDLITFCPSQYGLGTSGGDLKTWVKASSLAATLKVASSTFLGLFQLRDVTGEAFWWVCAIRSGLISAQSDMLFDTRESAESHIRVSIKGLLGDFEEEIVCEDDEESRTWLSPFLRSGLFPSRRGCLLPLRTRERNKRLAVVGGAATLLLALGFSLYALEHRAGQQAMETNRLTLLNKAARRKEVLDHPEKFFAPPQPAPDPAEMWSACAPAMFSLPLSASGWEMRTASCDGNSVTVTWNHKPGADYLLPPPRARLNKSPLEATSGFPLLAKPALRDMNRNFVHREEIRRYLYQVTQVIGARISLSFAPAERQVVDKIEIVAPWVIGKWELTSLPPGSVLEPFLVDALRLPGLTLTSIQYDKTSWTLKGKVYAVEKK